MGFLIVLQTNISFIHLSNHSIAIVHVKEGFTLSSISVLASPCCEPK